MTTTPLRRRVRWILFAAIVVGIDVKAALAVLEGRTHSEGGIGGGPMTSSWESYQMKDGSHHTVIRNRLTGTIVRHTIHHPPTWMGLCRVWWPAVAGGLATAVAIAVARTGVGRWVIGEMPPPRMTTRRWMFAVALLGLEGGLVLSTIRSKGHDPHDAPWLLIGAGLALLHGVAFLPAGVLLLHRRVRARSS